MDIHSGGLSLDVEMRLLSYSHCPGSSDGVQVGNLASAMGVVGVWTTALHELGALDSHVIWIET